MPISKKSGIVFEIVIDISSGSDARAFENSGEIIQLDAAQAFLNNIKLLLKSAREYPEYFKRTGKIGERCHDTIAIFGKRGSGKTTFILNMFKLIQEKPDDKLSPLSFDSSDMDKIEVLSILDPTLVEAKEHVFVNIISAIKQVVDKKFERSPDSGVLVDPCDPMYKEYDPSRKGEYRDWQNSLKLLAAGLHAIDGIGENVLKKEAWHDPIHVMEEGLKSVKASNDLEKNFHGYVAKSLKFINKDAFILAFDDVDTDFTAGWPVLETIRKYLTTPQLITLLSGEPGLYAKLIRKRQWENFGETLLKCENNSSLGEYQKTNFHHMVNQLEDQYLLKILKPQRRIELKTVNDYMERKEGQVKIKAFKLFPEVELTDFIDSGIKELWAVENESLGLYRKFLLNEPIRTLVQLLIGMKRTKTSAPSNSDAAVSSAEELTDPNVVVETYFSTLSRYGYELNNMTLSPQYALNRLARILADHNLLNRGYRLKPEFEDNSSNRLMLALGAVYTRMIHKNPDLFFDYFIKIGLTSQISMHEPEIQPDKQSRLSHYMKWTGLLTGEDALTQSRYHTGYVLVNFAGGKASIYKRSTFAGSVALNSFDEKSRKTGDDKKSGLWESELFQLYGTYHKKNLISEKDKNGNYINLAAKFHDLFHDLFLEKKYEVETAPRSCFFSYMEELQLSLIEGWQTVLIGLPGQFVVNSFQEHTPLWSIHNLIAFIGELIRCEDKDGILILLKARSQLRDYYVPTSGEAGSPQENFVGELDEDDSKTSDLDENDRFIEFATLLDEWRKKSHGRDHEENLKLRFPVYVIAKMFARFYFSLGRIDDSGTIKNLGWSFNRFIIVFLNAVLVEEIIYRDSATSIRRKNPTGDDSIFIQNLKKVLNIEDPATIDGKLFLSEIHKKVPFFHWVLCCPVWHSYLDPDGQLFKWIMESKLYDEIISGHSYQKFLSVKYKAYKIDAVEFQNLYHILNAVLVQGQGVRQVGPGAKEKKENGLPKWSDTIKCFNESLPKTETKISDLKTILKDKSEPERTKYYIDEYINNCYSNVFTKDDTTKKFQKLSKKIADFLAEQ